MHIYELHVDTDSGHFATHYFDIHMYPWMWFHPLLGLIIRMPHSCAACKCWCCQFRVASAAVQLSSLVDCSLTCPFVWFLYMFQPLLSHIIQFPFVWVASVVLFLFFVCVYSTVALSFLSTLFKLLSPSFFVSCITTWQWTGSLFYHVTATSVQHHFRRLPFCFRSCTCNHLIPSHFPVFIVIYWQLTMFPFVFFLYMYSWTSFAHRYSFCCIYW